MQTTNGWAQSRLPGPARSLSAQAQYALALAFIVAIGALLRLHGLGTVSLNFDEGATSYFAHFSLSDLWGPPAWLETNPPLFYTIERGIVLLFGDGAEALRLASVAPGIVCIPLAALIARRVGGYPAGLAAALLVATSATNIITSQDARAYSLLTLAALIAIAAETWLLDAYRHPGSRNDLTRTGVWASYIGASVAALYLHNTAVLMVVALNLVAALCWVSVLGRQRRFALHWIVANAVIVALYAFWLPVVAYQSVHTLAHFWIPRPTLAGLRYGMENVYAQPSMGMLQPLPDILFLSIGLAGVVLHRSNRVLLGLAIFIVLGVPVLTWVVSQWRPMMNGETLWWLVPVFLVFVALGSTHFRSLAMPLTALLAVIQVSACYQHFRTRWDEESPEVASVLRTKAQNGDVIYLNAPSEEYLLNYYGWPRERLRVYAPSGPDPWFRAFDGTRLAITNVGQLDRWPRVWVLTRADQVEHRSIAKRLSGAAAEVLNRKFGHGLLRNQALRNLELSLFVAKPGGKSVTSSSSILIGNRGQVRSATWSSKVLSRNVQ